MRSLLAVLFVALLVVCVGCAAAGSPSPTPANADQSSAASAPANPSQPSDCGFVRKIVRVLEDLLLFAGNLLAGAYAFACLITYTTSTATLGIVQILEGGAKLLWSTVWSLIHKPTAQKST